MSAIVMPFKVIKVTDFDISGKHLCDFLLIMLTFVLSRTIYKLWWIISYIFVFHGVLLFDKLVSVIYQNIILS